MMTNKVFFLATVLISISLFSCEKELDRTQPGTLVPQTVDQDASLPHIQVNGTMLHSEAFGNPADPMLVFLHGGPGGDYRSALAVKQLAQNGYFVVFYDQRGSGLSQRHDKKNYSIQVMLDDLTQVIQHYRSTPAQKIYLFGHSWGAMLTAAYVNAYPDRISGAVFAEAGGFNKELLDEYASKSRKLTLLAEASNDALYYDQFLTGKENEHAVLDYKSALATSFAYAKGNNEGIEGPAPFWRNGAVALNAFVDIAEKDGFDFTQNLRQYPNRTLFLYAENNQSYGLAFAQKEASFFHQAEIVQIADTGHEMIYFKWNLVYPVVLHYLQSF